MDQLCLSCFYAGVPAQCLSEEQQVPFFSFCSSLNGREVCAKRTDRLFLLYIQRLLGRVCINQFHESSYYGLHLSVQYISKIRNMCKPTDTKYLRTFYRRCGMRGGYLELWNFPTDLRDQIYKFVSCKLCPPVPAQCAMDAVVNPPRPDEPSYATYTKVHLLLL